MDLVVAGFGNVPVLAEEAAHIATGGAHAEDASSRQKVVQRFFFDGIDLQGSGGAVSQAVKFAALIDADKTEASLAGIDVAVARAEIAVDAAIGFRFPPTSFVQSLRFLEDIQLRHESSLPSSIIRSLAEDFCDAGMGRVNVKFERGGAGVGGARRPNQRSAPSDRGISTSDGR